MMSTRRTAVIAATTLLSLTACGGDQVSRADAVGALTDTAVPERWAELGSSAATMQASVEAWCVSGESNALTNDIHDVRANWSRLAPFWFGPAMDRRSSVIIDPFVRADDIDDLLNGTEPLDAAVLRNLYGADQRGLQAIDYVADSASEAMPSDRQCSYARASATLVAEEAAALADEWSTAGPAMSVDEASANDALGGMVNEILFALSSMSDAEPTVADAKLAGVRWALIGTAGDTTDVGISALLDDDIVEQLATELDGAAATLDDESRMNLERTITTNIVSALGLSVQFSDADGDG